MVFVLAKNAEAVAFGDDLSRANFPERHTLLADAINHAQTLRGKAFG